MNLPTLAAFIADLTHSIDRLERVCTQQGGHLALVSEIARLHTTIEGLNALYEAEADRVADARFENTER